MGTYLTIRNFMSTQLMRRVWSSMVDMLSLVKSSKEWRSLKRSRKLGLSLDDQKTKSRLLRRERYSETTSCLVIFFIHNEPLLWFIWQKRYVVSLEQPRVYISQAHNLISKVTFNSEPSAYRFIIMICTIQAKVYIARSRSPSTLAWVSFDYRFDMWKIWRF